MLSLRHAPRASAIRSRSSGSSGPTGKVFGRLPERADVLYDGRSALPIANRVDRAGPVAKREPIVAKHPVEQADADGSRSPSPIRLGPVVREERTAQHAHAWVIAMERCLVI